MNYFLINLGSDFWKVGSRKLYAVKAEEIDRLKNRNKTGTKRKRTNQDCETALENLVDEVREVKDEIGKFQELAFRQKFSLSFIASLEDAFRCSICHRIPARTPLIACSGCASLVGCESCTNEWYSNDSLDKKCPKCRAERGLTKTFILRGFDEVIKQINLISVEGEAHNDNELDES